jgi:hypothetical protein
MIVSSVRLVIEMNDSPFLRLPWRTVAVLRSSMNLMLISAAMLVGGMMLTLFLLVAEDAIFDLCVSGNKHAAALQGHHARDRFALQLVR